MHKGRISNKCLDYDHVHSNSLPLPVICRNSPIPLLLLTWFSILTTPFQATAQKDFGDVIVGETRKGFYDWQAPNLWDSIDNWWITSVDFEAKSGNADFNILSVAHDQNRAMPPNTPRYCPLTTAPGPFHGRSSLQGRGIINVDWEVKATGIGRASAALVIRGGAGLVGIGNVSSPLWISLNGIYDIRRFNVTHVGMRNSRILDIHTDRDFGGRTYPVTVSAVINGKSVSVTANLSNNSLVPSTPFESSPISIDLATAGVPRFSENVTFTLSASVGQVKKSKQCAIPLPVVFVPGIDPTGAVANNPTVFGGNHAFQAFEDALNSEFYNRYQYNGYNYLARYVNSQPDSVPPSSGTVTDPYYPTLHTLSFFGLGVDRNSVGLLAGGSVLNGQIDLILNRTYADKVNIIAHSKGCLITRGMFAKNYTSGKKVNKLIMIQGPHMGSIFANGENILSLVTQYGVPVRDFFTKGYSQAYTPDVYQNLTPVYNWVRPLGKRLFDNSEVNNPELIQLNKVLMPSRSGVKYYIFYSDTVSKGASGTGNYYTKIYVPKFKALLGYIYSRGPGDFIVPKFSQLGYAYNTNNRRATPRPIKAFSNIVALNQVKCGKLPADHMGATAHAETHRRAWSVLWDVPSDSWLVDYKNVK